MSVKMKTSNVGFSGFPEHLLPQPGTELSQQLQSWNRKEFLVAGAVFYQDFNKGERLIWGPCSGRLSLQTKSVPVIRGGKSCHETAPGWSSVCSAFGSDLPSLASHGDFPNFPRLIGGTSRWVWSCSSGTSRRCFLRARNPAPD